MLLLNENIQNKCLELELPTLSIDTDGVLRSICGKVIKRFDYKLSRRLTGKERELILKKASAFLETFTDDLKKYFQLEAKLKELEYNSEYVNVSFKSGKNTLEYKAVVLPAYYSDDKYTIKFAPVEFFDSDGNLKLGYCTKNGKEFIYDYVVTVDTRAKRYPKKAPDSPFYLSDVNSEYVEVLPQLVGVIDHLTEMHQAAKVDISIVKAEMDGIMLAFLEKKVC